MEDALQYARAAAYLGAALVIGIGILGPAIAQGLTASKACENIGKYPESAGFIRTTMILAMSIIETSPIFLFLISMFLIYVGYTIK
jgi:F-type H+-transporting ATPase subunit c